VPEVEGNIEVGGIQAMFPMTGFCLVTGDGSLDAWKVSLMYAIGLCVGCK